MVFDVSTIIDIILAFVVGLLFGLSIKKGLLAFVLGLAGFVIAGYIGLSFVPTVSVSYIINKAFSEFSHYVGQVQFGSIALSLTVVVFAVGLVVGLWKG